MAATKRPTFVAVTEVKHDGEVVALPGDTVDHLDNETLHHLYVNGVLAVQGSADDPNTWVVHPDAYNTTPRLVEDSLRRQVADELFGVETEGAHTQPHLERPKNPAELLGLDPKTGQAPDADLKAAEKKAE